MMRTTMFQKYTAYKDSGVEWLGEIPEHWEVKRFKHMASYQKGKLPKNITSIFHEGLYPYMSMEYLRGKEANQWVVDKEATIVEEDNILLLWDGSNSGEFIKSKKGIISSTVAIINYKNINKQFAWYYSNKIEQKLRGETIGMGIPHVNGLELQNSLVCIPPIEEQTAIAAFLDDKTAKIDLAIAQKEKMIALLKERKQIIIQNLVTGKKVWNATQNAWTEPVEVKDSGVEWIGEIPEGWKVVKNKTIFQEKNQPGREGLPLLSVSIHSAVSDEELEEDINIRGKIKIQDKSNYKFVSVNDIVFNMMRAWQGAIGAVRTEGMVSPAYIVAKPDSKIISAYFEYQYRTSIFIQQMNWNSRGITDFRKRLYWDEFKQLKTVIPPKFEQNQIVTYIETQSAKIDKAIGLQEQQIEKLKELKATLIDGAVTGKIKITD